MPCNFSYIFDVKTHTPLFLAKINRLTWSGRYFIFEQLRKAKGKKITNFDNELEVNKFVIEKKSIDFLKLIKHDEYCIIN